MADEEFDFDALEARIQAAKQAKNGTTPTPKPEVKARAVTVQDKPRAVVKAATVKTDGDPVARRAMAILNERGGDIGEGDKPAPRPVVPMRTNSEWLAIRDEAARGGNDLSIIAAAPMPARSAPPKPTVIDMGGDVVTENSNPVAATGKSAKQRLIAAGMPAEKVNAATEEEAAMVAEELGL